MLPWDMFYHQNWTDTGCSLVMFVIVTEVLKLLMIDDHSLMKVLEIITQTSGAMIVISLMKSLIWVIICAANDFTTDQEPKNT